MSHEPKLPDFDQFSRWLVVRLNKQVSEPNRYESVREDALAARDEFLQSQRKAAPRGRRVPHGSVEVLQLLAAADKSDSSLPSEITTPRGFRLALAYDEGSTSEASSICVLVHCPAELIASLEGETVYLWFGVERFELGQFDGEGKAIGMLPSGLEITASDFTLGKVKLEEPTQPAGK